MYSHHFGLSGAPIVAPDDTTLRNLRSHQAEDYWDDGALAPPATNIAELNARDASLQWWEDGLADEETTHSTPERTAGVPPRTSDTGGNNVSDLPEDSSATLPYQVLPPDQWNLATAHNNLRQDHNGYRILFHEAWLQPVYSREEAQSVLIEGGQVVAQLQRELSGYLTLSASRYLHLDVDLWLQDEERLRRGHQKKARVLTLVPVLPGTLSLETDAGLDSDDNDALSRVLRQLHATDTPARPLLRMRQHRKMTAQSLHFLDHPAFGVLISVAPAPTNPDQ